MSDDSNEYVPGSDSRDRREHGGMPPRPDDDELARRTEAERVEAGLEDYDPNEVPPATDTPPQPDPTGTEQWQEENAEVERELEEGELEARPDRPDFPPSSYEDR
ncbi:DEAD/DEAH box helicase [Streptacidiphilus monticola]|uniref:DEAD/DEAH box helicase n=1 Tax=Streptacidiphilus monticola TaxID=2161674 RepID=A0ABW1FWU2_9ACTN